jgi:phosphatidylglycerol:prolipoprotein diacylglycerol transferase
MFFPAMNAILLAAYYVHNLSPFLWEVTPGVGLRWYGLSYVAAFIAGWILYRHLSRRGYADLTVDKVGDFITWWVVLGTLIGGRLGYLLFYQPHELLQNPLVIFRVWEGGMSAHGGMLGLVAATWLYAVKHKISWLNLGDNLCVVAPVGLFFGRLANFINGELYGRATQVWWAVQFPKEMYSDPSLVRRALENFPAAGAVGVDSLVAGVRESEELREVLGEILTPRHPSQLYQAGFEGLLLFAFLWWVRTKKKVANGVLTGLFFIGYAVARSSMEFFREPDAGLTAGLTRGQFLSVLLLLLGAAFLLYAWRNPSYPLAWSTPAKTVGKKK